VNVKDYRFIFFKRYTERKNFLWMLLDSAKERRSWSLFFILAFVIKKLIYEIRYSKEGIKKQVEDAVDRILMKVLEKVFRFIGQVHFVKTYLKISDWRS
jgi:hypothetical protein